MPVTGIGSAAATDAVAALLASFGSGSDLWLKQCAAAFGLVFTSITATDTTTGLPTSAVIAWPDGTSGAFTGSIDADGNGFSGYVATYAGTTTRTVTASGISYDANGNAIGPTSLGVS